MTIKFRGAFWTINNYGLYRDGEFFDGSINIRKLMWVQATKRGLKIVLSDYACYVTDTGIQVVRDRA